VLTIMSHGVVLFTASTRSRREIEDLAAEARRLRPDVEIVIRPPAEPAYRYKPAFPRCSADPPTENDVGSVGSWRDSVVRLRDHDAGSGWIA
jgi:hypothetical protein